MFSLPNLPFEKDALAPYISSETLDYHYGKHHQAYVDNLNKLSAWSEYENMELEEIVKVSSWPIFNNAAQIWNHTFFWNCLSPNSWKPSNNLLAMINRDFWSLNEFKKKFTNSAMQNFWSGWTWLVLNLEWKLEIKNTSNAETIITTDLKPLLVIDVWEHAYYIDYRNARPKFIENFWNIVNWENIKV